MHLKMLNDKSRTPGMPKVLEIEALDVIGNGATLAHHIRDRDPSSPGPTFVGSMQSWFDPLWKLLAVQLLRRGATW
ncbi:hypothetical protein ACFYOF_20745 [Streptomyces sp. NPDC007148]|uniref:hypothetical protein n=1 Tax=Streptomyces sp. NPDC007148 TaxID=3364775 RepID=UPI0036CC833B